MPSSTNACLHNLSAHILVKSLIVQVVGSGAVPQH